MKVRELLEKLADCQPDDEVKVFAHHLDGGLAELDIDEVESRSQGPLIHVFSDDSDEEEYDEGGAPSTSIAEFVTEVDIGEGGSGSVYLDGFWDGRDWYIGVANDDLAPCYRLNVEPTAEALAAVEARLTAGGLSVWRDQVGWAKELRRWQEMGSVARDEDDY